MAQCHDRSPNLWIWDQKPLRKALAGIFDENTGHDDFKDEIIVTRFSEK
jgi:hypothetical protein